MLIQRRLIAVLSLLSLCGGCGKPTEPDTQPPLAEIVYPVDGSDVFGVVKIRAVAQDTSGISRVEFYTDGELAPDGVVREPPYIYLWDTTVLPESTSHTISATARDESENLGTSDTISVIVLSPLTYTIVATHPTPVYASNLSLDGGLAYIADYGGGLQIVDISNPVSPFLVGVWDSLKYFWDVLVEGDYAYLADDEKGLIVLDVSDPANPSFVGSCGMSNGGRAVAVSGNYAYLADDEENIQIFDVAEFDSIRLKATYPLGKQAYDLWVSGDLAFVVVGDTIGLKVLDVSGNYPNLIGELETPNETKGIYLEGNFGYLADGGYGGLQVVDLSDPGDPEIVGDCVTFGYAYSVFVSGRYAYVADGAGGLVVVDMIRPEYPSCISHIDTPGFARGIFVSGDYAYIADGNNGMVIVGWSR